MKNIKKFNELFTSTYQSAAKKAQEKGLSGLADRFSEHGKKHGIRDIKSQITLYIERSSNTYETLTYHIGDVIYRGKDFKIELTNVDTGKTDWLYGSFTSDMNSKKLVPGVIKLYLNEDDFTLAETRRDAKILLKVLKENGFGYEVADERTLVKGYA